jgi:glutamate racemase
MKLGIFDSGLGGLVISKAIQARMPDLDILYLGDTLHLPYGKRSHEAIYMYTERAMRHMFEQGCKLIVIACNTASAAALRRLQQEWLPVHYPDRNIIGVVVPTLEAAVEQGYKKIGLIGTSFIAQSNIYQEELSKISPQITLLQKATPLLVPLIEDGGLRWAPEVLAHYLQDFIRAQIECLILGCTHYPFLKDQIRQVLGPDVFLLSQDDIIPAKLENYLKRHPEYGGQISQGGAAEFYVSDLTPSYAEAARTIYGHHINIHQTVPAS